MLPIDSKSIDLIDPVCGTLTNTTSEHSCVRGGAMFFFCSDACRSQFVRDPLRFVVINAPESVAPVPVPHPPVAEAVAAPVRPVAVEQVAQPPEHEKGSAREGNSLRGLIAENLLAWRERRHAARTTDELLALYRTIAAEYPDVADREHFKRMVMARTGCDATSADAILVCAEESFAEWPAKRALTLCDVVHYLSVSEYLGAHEDQRSVQSNIDLVVTSRVPYDLCKHRSDK